MYSPATTSSTITSGMWSIDFGFERCLGKAGKASANVKVSTFTNSRINDGVVVLPQKRDLKAILQSRVLGHVFERDTTRSVRPGKDVKKPGTSDVFIIDRKIWAADLAFGRSVANKRVRDWVASLTQERNLEIRAENQRGPSDGEATDTLIPRVLNPSSHHFSTVNAPASDEFFQGLTAASLQYDHSDSEKPESSSPRTFHSLDILWDPRSSSFKWTVSHSYQDAFGVNKEYQCSGFTFSPFSNTSCDEVDNAIERIQNSSHNRDVHPNEISKCQEKECSDDSSTNDEECFEGSLLQFGWSEKYTRTDIADMASALGLIVPWAEASQLSDGCVSPSEILSAEDGHKAEKEIDCGDDSKRTA